MTSHDARRQRLRRRTRMSGWKLGTLGAVSVGLAIAIVGIPDRPAQSQQAVADSAHSTEDYRWVLNNYCVLCHSEKYKFADIDLGAARETLEDPTKHAGTWEKTIRAIRRGVMPPQGMPQPDKETLTSLASYLQTSLDNAAAANPNPGRPVLHRLNRTEYANAVRDLLGVEPEAIAVADLLPVDDAGYGFDNIGDVLTVSPLLMEGYLSAARKIGRIALGDKNAGPAFETYEQPRFLIQDERMSEDQPLGTRGGAAIKHNFPLDAEYVIRINLHRNGYTYTLGTARQRQIDVRIDGVRVKTFAVGGDYKGRRPEQPSSFGQGEYERYLINAGQNLELRVPVKAGTHLVQVAFPSQTTEPEGIYQPPIADYSYALSYGRSDMEPGVANIAIGGPFDAKGLGDTPSRARIFVCKPIGQGEENSCAKEIVSRLARNAYRRPATEADITDLMGFYETARASGDFEDGIRAVVQRVLVDPEFLFRVEKEPANAAPGTAYRIGDLELASRLSFFLWSSIPDEELLKLAEANKLHEPGILEQQTRRMLADEKAAALLKNFAGQWLYLRNVEQTWPNPDVFPGFDANLREAFLKESELFVESQLREDKSVLDLLTADYTFINERLARHYDIQGVYGSRFRRVKLSGGNRQGILGHGSILTVTSFATRTAPTVRGKWLLETILGVPPPPPPADVPSLAFKKALDGTVLSMRAQMEAHRANPSCASCHRIMDPLGFALENFDATGKYRTVDGGEPIDASGIAPDGAELNGPADLRKYLISHPDEFVHTVASKLLTYALGRGPEYYDEPALRKIIKESESGEYRWSNLILNIVRSTPFQMKRSRES